MCAALASTTSRSARGAPIGCAIISPRGVDANHMHTISYGKERSAAVCNEDFCHSQNRRAVTVLNVSS